MLVCLVIAGSLWIGDEKLMYPTQGSFYFHKFQDTIKIYGNGGDRYGSFVIPKEFKNENTISGVFQKCSEKNNIN